MENWWICWQMSKIKQRELLKEAERYRLLERSRPNRKVDTSSKARAWWSRLCYGLGKRLVSWGTKLQERQQTLSVGS